MDETTARFSLPLLIAGQGQKDISHNEALLLLDAVMHPELQSRSAGSPPLAPVLGQCWLIPAEAGGVWSGRDGQVTVWSIGGWRYLSPPGGYRAWLADEGRWIRLGNDGWRDEIALAGDWPVLMAPSGGAVIDVEARIAIGALLDRLSAAGLMEA